RGRPEGVRRSSGGGPEGGGGRRTTTRMRPIATTSSWSTGMCPVGAASHFPRSSGPSAGSSPCPGADAGRARCGDP
ncbi:hypothetical protein D3105_33300, partial [Streptomyces globisporus]